MGFLAWESLSCPFLRGNGPKKKKKQNEYNILGVKLVGRGYRVAFWAPPLVWRFGGKNICKSKVKCRFGVGYYGFSHLIISLGSQKWSMLYLTRDGQWRVPLRSLNQKPGMVWGCLCHDIVKSDVEIWRTNTDLKAPPVGCFKMNIQDSCLGHWAAGCENTVCSKSSVHDECLARCLLLSSVTCMCICLVILWSLFLLGIESCSMLQYSVNDQAQTRKRETEDIRVT